MAGLGSRASFGKQQREESGPGRRRWQQPQQQQQQSHHVFSLAPPSSSSFPSPSAMPGPEATRRKLSRGRRPGCRPRMPLLAAGLALCSLLALYASSSLGPSFLQPPLPAWRPEDEDEEPPPVKVLLWWEPFGRQRGLGGCEERFHIRRCHLTTDRSLLLEAHAVLFHHRDLVLHGLDLLPTSRLPAQRWVWMNFESPSHSHHLQDLGGLFNWTMSYKVDSDVFVPYGYLRPSRAPHPMGSMPKKTKLVAWVISNWNEEHARVRYYRRLKEHLPIDVYGAQGLELKDDSVVQTVSEYKFYLAFENSQHPDYITEKLWRNAFKAWAVPIVLGPPRSNYELFAPSDSFIHVEDFSDPRQLAVYLKFLDKNKSRYRKYFAWRKHYDVQVTSFWDEHCCKVCNTVRTAGKQHKTIQNLANWFES
ncbi:alpha-(1,3)-fucosyltransferase 4 [Anolis carolinensis]|uniref:alpha-(1,3)-fucosyltransferase 4 n=1 Tax=Anolis carolinensis TaxID=28377 RepID=UPI002F2B787D